MQKLCCVCTRQQFSASLDYFVTSSPPYLHQFSTISGGNCINPTIFMALIELSSNQATTTEATKCVCHQFPILQTLSSLPLPWPLQTPSPPATSLEKLSTMPPSSLPHLYMSNYLMATSSVLLAPLSSIGQVYHAVPHRLTSFPNSLISIGILCDHDCTAIFDKHNVNITCNNSTDDQRSVTKQDQAN